MCSPFLSLKPLAGLPRRIALNRALTANEVHDDRNDRKQQKKVDEKSGRLEGQKAPDPDNKQNDSENEKHRFTFFLCHGWVRMHPVAKKRKGVQTLPERYMECGAG